MPGSFFDSNVLLYLVSSDDIKRNCAENLMRAGGVISVQVLNEIANVCRRKFRMSWEETVELLLKLRRALEVEPMVIDTHDRGLRLAQRYELALYDSMLIGAAVRARCDTFWSEDMHDGLVIEGQLTIRNPFVSSGFD